MNMEKAGKRKKALALAQEKVTKEGYGEIDVTADGCWSKNFLVQPLYWEKTQQKFFIWE